MNYGTLDWVFFDWCQPLKSGTVYILKEFFYKAHFIPKFSSNDVQFLDWELFKRLSSSSSNPWNKLCNFECLISYLWLSHTYLEIPITCLHLCHYHLKIATHHPMNNRHVIFMDIPSLIPFISPMTILLGFFVTDNNSKEDRGNPALVLYRDWRIWCETNYSNRKRHWHYKTHNPWNKRVIEPNIK